MDNNITVKSIEYHLQELYVTLNTTFNILSIVFIERYRQGLIICWNLVHRTQIFEKRRSIHNRALKTLHR